MISHIIHAVAPWPARSKASPMLSVAQSTPSTTVGSIIAHHATRRRPRRAAAVVRIVMAPP